MKILFFTGGDESASHIERQHEPYRTVNISQAPMPGDFVSFDNIVYQVVGRQWTYWSDGDPSVSVFMVDQKTFEARVRGPTQTETRG